VPNDFDGNPSAAAPARYYDVTLAANGITTLSGANITVDKLTVNGAGTGLTIASGASLTTLIVTNSFAGTTQVDGTLNSPNGVQMFGGILSGSGTVNAAAGVSFLLGAVAPGTVGTPGTLTINGPVTLGAGSTTVVDVGTTSDLLKINGAAIVGGTLVVNPLVTAQQGQSYTVLSATSISGAYNAVTDTLPGVLFPSVSQVGNTEVVSIKAGSFVTLLNGAGTADQTQVAAGLDAARGAHYNDLLPLYQAIDPLSGTALGQALENLAPDAQRTAPLVGDIEANAVDNMILQHMGNVGTGAQTAGLTVDGDGIKAALNSANSSSFQSMQLISLGQGIATNPGGGNQAIPTTGTAASPLPAESMWLPGGASGFLSGSALRGSVAVGGGGGRADVGGLVIGGGLDMPVGDGFTVGAVLAYADASAYLRLAPESLQSDSIQGGLYVRYDWDNWNAEAFGVYGHQTMTTRRLVTVGATTFSLTGHTGGDTPSLGAYIGRSYRLNTINGAPLTLTPNLSLTYLSSGVDAFTETGGAPAMTFAGYSESSLTSRLGIDASIPFDVGSGIRLIPNAHLAWADSFSGNNGSIQAAFAAAPGSIMTFAMIARDRSYGELGLGLDADLGDFLGTQATLTGRYDANTRNDVQYGAWTGRLTIRW
jgi:outer membrane autotransporter protein